jgi:hypothetical protein
MPDTQVPGVAFRPPPVGLQPSLRAVVADAVAHIAPGKTGALVALVNEQGANAAVVARFGSVWDVQAWVGKSWKGSAQYGAVVRASW